MKNLVYVVALVFCLNAHATKSLFDEGIQNCVKKEITIQYESFKQFQFSKVLTFASDKENFEYIIFLEDDGKIVDRLFLRVIVGNFAEADLNLVGLTNKKLNLKNCF